MLSALKTSLTTLYTLFRVDLVLSRQALRNGWFLIARRRRILPLFLASFSNNTLSCLAINTQLCVLSGTPDILWSITGARVRVPKRCPRRRRFLVMRQRQHAMGATSISNNAHCTQFATEYNAMELNGHFLALTIRFELRQGT